MENTVIGTDLEINVGKNYKGKLGVSGKSEQATRSGNNKFDISKATKASGSCSFKNNGDSIDITTTYIGGYISANIDITDLFKEGETIYAKANFVASSSNTGAYRIQWSEDSGLNKGDIVLISFTSDSVKSGVVPTKPEGATKLLLYLYGNVEGTVAIGDTVTYSKIMLSNQPITDYEEYGAMPSPDFPSEIKNVGDNINLLNKDTVDASNNLRGNALDTGRRLIANKDGAYTYGVFKLGGRELLGKTLGIHADIETTGGNPMITIFAGNSSSLTKSRLQVVLSASGTGYMTIPSNLNSELDTISAVLYVTTDASVAAGTYVDYTNLKVQVGSEEVVYSAYNRGSLGITIRNENFGDAELLYSQMKNFSFSNIRKELVDNKNCIVFLNTQFRSEKGFKGLKFNYKKNTRYVIRGKFRIYDTSITSGKDLWVGAYDKDGNSIGHNNYQANGSKWIQFSFLTDINSSFDHIGFSYGTAEYWCLDMDSLEIYEGTSVREVPKSQVQTITFPLAKGQKLRSLPNGVKDYLAEDGIHKNVGIIILNGSGGINENYFKATNNKFALGVNTEKGLLLKNLKTDNLKISVLSDKFLGVSWDIMNDTIEGWQIALRQDGSYTYLRLLTTGIEDAKALETFLQNNNAIVEYPLATEEIIPYTQEQKNAFYQLQNIVLYDGINHISTDNELGSMSVEVSKIIEDYETYISSNGFFINSQNDIHYLIDFSESELPCMAEATETTVKAAGRNGDIVLSTTYDANNFNIVCYTEDNLTQEEKVKEEMKLKKLLNSIKNKTIPLAFEKDDKFYKVKYSGAFSSTNFPKHLKFSIPLKTSEAYGKDLIKKVIFGNGEETSDTFEDVGAIFTIKGPANSPIISLNDYSIEYDNPLLEGDKLIINSSNSTITHINSDGVATNAMRYYNHQFPKIENGKNVLKVLSGVNEANVSVEWYDYKF